jgi:hypothetical protein
LLHTGAKSNNIMQFTLRTWCMYMGCSTAEKERISHFEKHITIKHFSFLFYEFASQWLKLSLQSLVMVYAHLIHTQLDAVLNFLSTVPGPTGQSALQFVLTEWCSRQHLFYGAYEQKVRYKKLGVCFIFGRYIVCSITAD